MTRDEVNAMTDEELRIKAYELTHLNVVWLLRLPARHRGGVDVVGCVD